MEPSSTWGQGKQELIRVELGLMVQGSEVMLCWGMQDRFLVDPSGAAQVGWSCKRAQLDWADGYNLTLPCRQADSRAGRRAPNSHTTSQPGRT